MGLTAFLGEHDIDYMDRYQEDDLEDIYKATVEMQPSKPRKVTSLLELSSIAVAKSCSCEVLESAQPPLDEGLLKKVHGWELVLAPSLAEQWPGCVSLKGATLVNDFFVLASFKGGGTPTEWLVAWLAQACKAMIVLGWGPTHLSVDRDVTRWSCRLNLTEFGYIGC